MRKAHLPEQGEVSFCAEDCIFSVLCPPPENLFACLIPTPTFRGIDVETHVVEPHGNLQQIVRLLHE